MADSRCESPLSWHLLQCAHGSRVWLPRRCRRCTGCKRARRNKTIARLSRALETSSQIAFLTLTSPPGTEWPQLMRRWQQMVRYLRRSSPALQYAAIKEEGTRAGMKHLHVILTNFTYTPQRSISAEWNRLIGAWVVNIQRLESTKAATYVAKYVSKELDNVRKNVTYSKDFPKLPPSGLHCVPLDEVGPWGPQTVATSTDDGGFVVRIVDGCHCFGDTHTTTLEEHLWLRSLPARSPPVSAAH